jgi:hypothetical protein
MKIVIIYLFLLKILTILIISTISKISKISKITTSTMTIIKNNIRHKLRNKILKYIVFKEKKMNKLCNVVKDTLNSCHNKSIVALADSYYIYDKLSEEDKIIIETILTLCY